MTEAADASKTADQKADAKQGGTVMDAVLSKLDSLHKRMDDIESKGKADAKAKGDGDIELVAKEKKAEKEAAGENEKVIDKKKDARGDEWPDKDKDKDDSKKADAKRKDEFPPKDKDEDEDKKNPFGDKKDSKADAKRSDRDKDEDTTTSNVEKDSKRGDAKGRRDSPDWDEQQKEISKGDARADAYVRVKASDWENVTQRLTAIDQFVNRSDDDRAKFAEVQERADAIYGAHSKRAPANLPGETLADYKRRLVTPFRQYSTAWKDVKMSELPESAFANVEGMIYADALKAAESPIDLGPGELRRRDITDPETRVHRIEWVGNESFIKALSQEPRRVSGFRSRHTG